MNAPVWGRRRCYLYEVNEYQCLDQPNVACDMKVSHAMSFMEAPAKKAFFWAVFTISGFPHRKTRHPFRLGSSLNAIS
jgi:hypothetical protein